MLDNPLISVIVPVYKVEFWLPKCIKSICHQTYKNIEIILVDDGSPDASPALCDKFAKKDSRIKTIHKENGGVSSARNVGINASHGEYIFFIDADDWILPNTLDVLYNAAKTNDAQITICEMLNITRKKNTLINHFGKIKLIDITDNDTATEKELKECTNGGAVGKLYKASVIKDNNILFDCGVKLAEDIYFHLECIKNSNRILILPNSLYMYNRLVYDSAITKFYPEISDWMIRLAEIRETAFFQKNIKADSLQTYISDKCFEELEFIVLYCAQKCTEQKRITELYKKYFERVKKYFSENPDSEQKKQIYNYCINSDYNGLYEYANKLLNTTNKPLAIVKFRQFIGKIFLHFRIIKYRYF